MDARSGSQFWVRTARQAGRCFLLGNAHTFPGRIHAWDEETQTAITISKRDILEYSDGARAWVDGFLAGTEPSVTDFLGIAADDVDYGADDVQRWQAAMKLFRAEGELAPLMPRPRTAVSAEAAMLNPWAIAGGQVYVCQEGAWVRGAPRQLDGSFDSSSICAETRMHSMAFYEPCHSVCIDCGYCTEMDEE